MASRFPWDWQSTAREISGYRTAATTSRCTPRRCLPMPGCRPWCKPSVSLVSSMELQLARGRLAGAHHRQCCSVRRLRRLAATILRAWCANRVAVGRYAPRHRRRCEWQLYIANYSGQVNVLHTNNSQTTFVDLKFSPAGIAIDNVRGRVYISNFNGDSIAVYSTAGVLLHTIK